MNLIRLILVRFRLKFGLASPIKGRVLGGRSW
jgi:hypothetical protein